MFFVLLLIWPFLFKFLPFVVVGFLGVCVCVCLLIKPNVLVYQPLFAISNFTELSLMNQIAQEQEFTKDIVVPIPDFYLMSVFEKNKF